jgi:hypothetical protein
VLWESMCEWHMSGECSERVLRGASKWSLRERCQHFGHPYWLPVNLPHVELCRVGYQAKLVVQSRQSTVSTL